MSGKMPRTQRPERRDRNEAGIIDALTAAGAEVRQMRAGIGYDLNVFHHGVVFIIEVKMPGEKLTANERVTREALERQGVDYWVVYSAEDALDAVVGVVA